MPSSEPWSDAWRHKWVEPKGLAAWRNDMRERQKSVATLNGSFDLLHAGHLHIIFEASKQADVLLVALNSDSSIQEYKDPRRPIVPLEHRLPMVAALAFVDYITSFDETDPRALLEVVRPDIHVNGSDWGVDCVEAEVVQHHGGTIQVVELVPGLSTSQLVNKIRDLNEA